MKVLVVDDERGVRNSLKDILEYENVEAAVAENGIAALELFRKHSFDLVFCDIKMPGIDGIEVLEKMQAINSDIPVVMISGHGNIDTAVECIKKGAYDFIEKPLDLNRILITMRNAGDRTALVKETKKLQRKVFRHHEMIGDSEGIRRVRDIIERVAPTDARILVTGQNGTGKELVARLLHGKSGRSSGAFVEVNCAAIPSELIESELFGHEKGSFTSAVKQHKGKFEQANGGTLFLDEIGDMSPAAQAKVLRALQENKILRVGGDKDIQVDVRVIAATNKNLREEIEKGNFREDLYHRISVILIQVPSLNERRGDIPLLAEHFIREICEEYSVPKKEITEAAIAELEKLMWTGNIREFRNVIERLIILCDRRIDSKDVKAYANPLFV
ncbi:MAG: sigma-54 dependent transcriptional regulator [Prevotellaceae bacterium]|jgi:DNA-binding NtrC family response regulator|nr:sigma-54 dependent transcriptional regulator [Prevotellaceae bacterium]